MALFPIATLNSLTTFVDFLRHSLALTQELGLWQLFQRVGVYDVLEHKVKLELQDPTGEVASYDKWQKICFTQNNVVAIQDRIWGVGDIFAAYTCSIGKVVDRYKEGHLYHVLISLRKTMNKGDIEMVHIRRIIRGGFTLDHEDLQTEINHRTHKISVKVIFPAQRRPKDLCLIEQNTKRVIPLGQDHCYELHDGRFAVCWEKQWPRLFEAYIVSWDW